MRFLLVLFSMGLLWSQSTEEFEMTIKASPRFGGNNRGGECEIRVRIDNRAYAELRGARMRVRTLQGAPSYNEGSWCSSALPMNPNGFNFQQTQGRNRARLEQRPSGSNSGTARIYIEDANGGSDTYAFRVSWNGGGGDGWGNGGGWDQVAPPGGGNGWGGNNNWSSSGSGEVAMPMAVNFASLERQGNQGVLKLRTQNGDFELAGNLRQTNANRLQLDVTDCRGNGMYRCSGTATVTTDGNRIRTVVVSGNSASGRYSVNFRD